MKLLVLRRLVGAVAVMVLASVMAFTLVKVAPGDEAQSVARQRLGTNGTPRQLEQIRNELGLKDSWPVQYGRWVSNAVRGDLGTSLETDLPIRPDVTDRAGVTTKLTTGAITFGLLVGVLFGVLGAMRPRGLADRVLRGLSLVLVSVPTFFAGLLLVLLFALNLGWLPTSGDAGLTSYLLPWVTLGLAPAGAIGRVVRTTLGEELGRSYIPTALSRGYTRRGVLLREALPNTAPALLAIAGVQFGLVFINTVVVEAIFGLQGLGQFFVHAAQFRDLPVLQATLFIFALVFVVLSILVDLAQAGVDPRIRRASTR